MPSAESSSSSSQDNSRSHSGSRLENNDNDSSDNLYGEPDSHSGPGEQAPGGSASASELAPAHVVVVATSKATGKRKAAAPKQANKRVRKPKNQAPQQQQDGNDNSDDEEPVVAPVAPKKKRKPRVNKPKSSPPDPNDPNRKRQFAARMQAGERLYNDVLKAMAEQPWLNLGAGRALFGIKSFLPPAKIDPRQLLYWLFEDTSHTVDASTYKHLFMRLRALAGARYTRLTGVTTSVLKGTELSGISRWLRPSPVSAQQFLPLIDNRDRAQFKEIIALDLKALVAEVEESLATTVMLCELYQLSKNNRLYVDIHLKEATPALYAMKQRTFGLYQAYRPQFDFHLDLLEGILQQTMQVRSAPSHGKIMPAPPVQRADLSMTADYPKLLDTIGTAWIELADEHELVQACIELVPTQMRRNTERGGEVTTHTMLRSWIKQVAALMDIELARPLVVSSTVYSRVADFISTHFGISVQQKKSLDIHIISDTPLLRGRRGNSKAFKGVFSNSLSRRAERAVAVATARPVVGVAAAAAAADTRTMPRLLESPSQLPDAEAPSPQQQQEQPAAEPEDDFELEEPAAVAAAAAAATTTAAGYVMADIDDAY